MVRSRSRSRSASRAAARARADDSRDNALVGRNRADVREIRLEVLDPVAPPVTELAVPEQVVGLGCVARSLQWTFALLGLR